MGRKEYLNSWYLKNKERILARRKQRRGAILSYFHKRVVEHKTFLNSLKEGNVCVDCKRALPTACLEFDHVRPGKRYALANMNNHRREAVQEELERCEIVCCVCHRLRTKARQQPVGVFNKDMRERREKFLFWMSQLKSEPCMDCGLSFSSVAMDFDHVRGEKVKGISAMWSWSRGRVLKELAKCDLVCANCHRLRTHKRQQRPNAA